MMTLPKGALFVLDSLTRAGYAAYVVGGCVRDALMGHVPGDYDICTSALPEEMQQVFRGCHVVETGLQHGRLTVVVDHIPYEVTTFRIDGEYTDHRHPDSVCFVNDVTQDLARRDFTVNAMAYHPASGLVDPFGGQEDLAKRVIRCVGDAPTRFREDALRILRALRFASTKQFIIEEKTSQAARALSSTLDGVAAERIRAELAKLLCGAGCGDILREYHDILCICLPQLTGMKGFDQHNPHHRYDLWEHTVRAIENVPPVEALRLTMLLHDVGKMETFTLDENGVGHMYQHASHSQAVARDVAALLKLDRATADTVELLVAHHDIEISPDPKLLKRRLNKFGEDNLRRLIDVQHADRIATGTCSPAESADIRSNLIAALDALLAQAPCFTLKSLAVNGRDMMQLGLKGPDVGSTLNRLLECVMDETIPNEKEALLSAAQRFAQEAHTI